MTAISSAPIEVASRSYPHCALTCCGGIGGGIGGGWSPAHCTVPFPVVRSYRTIVVDANVRETTPSAEVMGGPKGSPSWLVHPAVLQNHK